MSIDLIIPEPSAVVKTNELLLGIKVDGTRIEKVRSCFSSYYYYYELTEEQIASIINALIKNHCFLDANKMRPLSSSCFILESNIFLFINKKCC